MKKKNTIEAAMAALNGCKNFINTKGANGIVTQADITEYVKKYRSVLNESIFFSIAGLEMVPGNEKKGGKLKISGSMISEEEKREFMKALEEFQASAEIPFTSALSDADVAAAEAEVAAKSEDTPAENMEVVTTPPTKPGRLDYCTNIDMCNNQVDLKLLFEAVGDGDFWIENAFGISAVEELYSLGKELRKKRLIKRFIIGGSAIAIVSAAGIITLMALGKKDSDGKEDYTDDEDIDVDIDDDVPVVETDTSSDAFVFNAFGYNV